MTNTKRLQKILLDDNKQYKENKRNGRKARLKLIRQGKNLYDRKRTNTSVLIKDLYHYSKDTFPSFEYTFNGQRGKLISLSPGSAIVEMQYQIKKTIKRKGKEIEVDATQYKNFDISLNTSVYPLESDVYL